MTREQFKAEFVKLILNLGTQPTKEFCQFFLDNLATGEQLVEAGYDESNDYNAWGYSFYEDIHHDGEEAAALIDIWDWVDHYHLND